MTDKFGDSLKRMTAVTDRHSAYIALHFLNHQICLAHLLRELQYMSELNTKQNWSDKITDLFREAIHERKSNPSAIIPKTSWTERLDNLLKINGSERGIRKLKIKLKNSCTFRSDLGADALLELHSIVETAKKYNRTPFNAIQALFEA